MGLKLYEIRAEYDVIVQAALRIAEDNEGVIPDDLAAKIDAIAGTMTDRAVSCGHIYKNSKAEAEAIGEEIRKLQARKRTAESLADSIRGYLSHNLPPGVKIDTPTVAISWRASSEVVVDDMAHVPEEYQRVTIEARKTDIKAAWKRGEKITGVHKQDNQNIQIL